MFARAVNEDATIKTALEGVILYKVDCEKGEGLELAKTLRRSAATPPSNGLNGKGEITDRWIGYDGADAWSALVDAGVKDQRTSRGKKAAFAQSPRPGLARSLANAATTTDDWKGAVAYFRPARRWTPTTPPNTSDEHRELHVLRHRGDDAPFGLDDLEAEAEPGHRPRRRDRARASW